MFEFLASDIVTRETQWRFAWRDNSLFEHLSLSVTLIALALGGWITLQVLRSRKATESSARFIAITKTLAVPVLVLGCLILYNVYDRSKVTTRSAYLNPQEATDAHGAEGRRVIDDLARKGKPIPDRLEELDPEERWSCDGWGQMMVLRQRTSGSGVQCTLISAGPDEQFGTSDDLEY
jgi:hypothetical protein